MCTIPLLATIGRPTPISQLSHHHSPAPALPNQHRNHPLSLHATLSQACDENVWALTFHWHHPAMRSSPLQGITRPASGRASDPATQPPPSPRAAPSPP